MSEFRLGMHTKEVARLVALVVYPHNKTPACLLTRSYCFFKSYIIHASVGELARQESDDLRCVASI